VRYTPDWEPLSDALKRVMATGASEAEAKTDLCRAVAEGNIRVQVTIAGAGRLASAVFSGQRVRVPAHLNPDDFDWEQSRPHRSWPVGGSVFGPESYYDPYRTWERRQIDLIELATANVQSIFASSHSISKHGATDDDEKSAAVLPQEASKNWVAAQNNGPKNNGPKKRNTGRKPKFRSPIRRAVFKLMDHHGDLTDDDPAWSLQADVEKAVRAELGDNAPRGESTVRSYVSEFIAEWRVEKQTKGR
jgi:hypothetical protein